MSWSSPSSNPSGDISRVLTNISQQYLSKTDPGLFVSMPIINMLLPEREVFRQNIQNFLFRSAPLPFCPICFADKNHSPKCPLAKQLASQLDEFPCGLLDDIGVDHRCDSKFDNVFDKLRHTLDFHPTFDGIFATRSLAQTNWRPEISASAPLMAPYPSVTPMDPTTLSAPAPIDRSGFKIVKRGESVKDKAPDPRFQPAVHAARRPEHRRRVVKR